MPRWDCSAPMRAHPRSRGENVIGQLLSAVGEGSSPLTRGKPSWKGPAAYDAGLIPAHAGKTGSARVTRRPIQAHPRSRGENYGVEIELFDGYGSSPLTRGKHRVPTRMRRRRRLIPAHAGKTAAQRRRVECDGAHPRSRGENFLAFGGLSPPMGSSPLTRGKRAARPKPSCDPGLIPAHAGKTAVGIGAPFPSGAHPRSRGENSIGASTVML